MRGIIQVSCGRLPAGRGKTSRAPASELNVICGRRHAPSSAGPVGVEELATGLIDALVGVRAKEVALRLQQVGGQPGGAISVEKRQCGRERGSRNSQRDRLHNGLAPGSLIFVQHAGEEAVKEEVVQVRLFV